MRKKRSPLFKSKIEKKPTTISIKRGGRGGTIARRGGKSDFNSSSKKIPRREHHCTPTLYRERGSFSRGSKGPSYTCSEAF